MFGVDLYQAGPGRMRGKLLGMITVADGSGQEFDLGELTTYLNDALMRAPSMLLTPAVTWGRLTTTRSTSACPTAQSRRPHGSYVDEQGRMVDFSTTDRWAALPGGLTRAYWTTPIDGWMDHEGRWIPTGGRAIWHFDTGEFEHARGRFVPESVEFNVPPGAARSWHCLAVQRGSCRVA